MPLLLLNSRKGRPAALHICMDEREQRFALNNQHLSLVPLGEVTYYLIFVGS